MRMRFLAPLLAALLLSSVSTANAMEELQAAIWPPPNHVFARYYYTDWASRAEELADGELEVQVDLGSAMLTPRGALAAVADGVVDVTLHTGQYTPSELNVSAAVEELAMLYEDPRIVLAAVAEFDLTDPMMHEQWQRNGVVYGGPYTTASYNLVCNKEVSTLEQLEGKKVRMPGRSPATWVNSAGAVTVSLNSNEQYSALDKGALDCTTTTPADMLNRKLHEVAGHVTEMPITLFWNGFGWGYNPDAWQRLSPEQRRALFDAQADAIAAMIVHGLTQEEKDAIAELKAAGVQFHEPDEALRQSLADFRAKQVDDAAAVATETFKVENPEELFERFTGTVEKWRRLLADVSMDDEKAIADLLREEIYDKIDMSTYGVN